MSQDYDEDTLQLKATLEEHHDDAQLIKIVLDYDQALRKKVKECEEHKQAVVDAMSLGVEVCQRREKVIRALKVGECWCTEPERIRDFGGNHSMACMAAAIFCSE